MGNIFPYWYLVILLYILDLFGPERMFFLLIYVLFHKPKVKDTLPPMPKKQNLAMLEAPPETKSTAYVGPPYKTLPPIGSAPPTGRQRQSTTPRKLSTAPGITETEPRGDRPSFSRTNSMPPEFPESVHYQSGHTTRQTVKTDGEATVGESVGIDDGRHQPRAGERLNTDDGFFMTQVSYPLILAGSTVCTVL